MEKTEMGLNLFLPVYKREGIEGLNYIHRMSSHDDQCFLFRSFLRFGHLGDDVNS